MSMRMFKYPTKVQVAIDKLCGAHEGTLAEAMFSIPVMYLTEHEGFHCPHEEVRLSKKVDDTEYCTKCGLAFWKGTKIPKFSKTRVEITGFATKEEEKAVQEKRLSEVSNFVQGWVTRVATSSSEAEKALGTKALKKMAELVGVKYWEHLSSNVKRLNAVQLNVLYDWMNMPAEERFPEEEKKK